jgi:hypothetical protein
MGGRELCRSLLTYVFESARPVLEVEKAVAATVHLRDEGVQVGLRDGQSEPGQSGADLAARQKTCQTGIGGAGMVSEEEVGPGMVRAYRCATS